MAHRCGGGSTKAIQVVMMMVVLIMMVTMPVEGDRTEEGDCIVKDSVEVKGQNMRVSLLAYVSYSTTLDMGYFFPGLDKKKDRDAVSINSTGATHTEVRGGKGPIKPITLPRLIPEGWNTFLVDVRGNSVTVTLVLGQDTLTLFTLPSLRKEVHSILAMGKVARCPIVTPTWKVNPGDKAQVVLHPAGGSTPNQWLEVVGVGWGAAAPYLDFPFASSSRVSVSENSTYRISSSVRGDHIHYQVFKEAKTGGGGDGDEEVTSGNISSNITSLRVEVSGGCGGDNDATTTTLFHLESSPPHTKSAEESVSSSSTGYLIACFVMLGLLVLVIAVALVLLERNDARRGNGVLASCFRGCKTKGEGRDSNEHTEAEGQEGNISLHMNGAYRGGSSEEGINGHTPSCDHPLLPNVNGTPTQRDPRCYHDYGKVDCPDDDKEAPLTQKPCIQQKPGI